jgi:phosphatidylserine/phosphatidylglycerophosphate/cardiolipin synthase-like enzyme
MAGVTTGKYKPQAHSTAQEAGEGSEATFFSGTPTAQTTAQGGSVLDSFTKGLNQALHGYARTLFPATSTYSAASEVAPEARTGNRFESFSPVRNGNAAKWYVDAKDYMYALSVALEGARENIWILDCTRQLSNTEIRS